MLGGIAPPFVDSSQGRAASDDRWGGPTLTVALASAQSQTTRRLSGEEIEEHRPRRLDCMRLGIACGQCSANPFEARKIQDMNAKLRRTLREAGHGDCEVRPGDQPQGI